MKNYEKIMNNVSIFNETYHTTDDKTSITYNLLEDES